VISDVRKMDKNIRIAVVKSDKKILFNHKIVHESAYSPISRKMVKVIEYDIRDLQVV
jgi:hypothetical protein